MQPDRAEQAKAARREHELRLQEEMARQRVRMLDAFGRVYATGKRKTSVARVWLWRGEGSILINQREIEVYFQDPTKRADVLSPFRVRSHICIFFGVPFEYASVRFLAVRSSSIHNLSCF